MTKESSRDRILRAAADVAREAGAGHLSLDAVAAKAGLSKGGLLYNFPTKAKLLQALVAHHLAEFDGELADAERALPEGRNRAAHAYLNVFERELERGDKPPSGLLAAIADDLTLLEPVRTYMRGLIDRLAGGRPEPIIAYLVVEGLRSSRLFETNTLTKAETDAVRARLKSLLAEQ